MHKPTRLYYCYDPMCSWCWGFKPVWEQMQETLQEKYDLDIVYVLGGLAPETDEAMGQGMREQLQQTWREIEALTGVRFNHDFWTRNTPRRSTYPACKAALVARKYGLEKAMYQAIQELYYVHAGNPSDYDNLYALAESLGLDRQTFIDTIHSRDIDEALREDIMLAERLGAQGLPSLILFNGRQHHFINHSYTDHDASLIQVDQLINTENSEALRP